MVEVCSILMYIRIFYLWAFMNTHMLCYIIFISIIYLEARGIIEL